MTSLKAAKHSITAHLDSAPRQVFTQRELQVLIRENRRAWGISSRKTAGEIIDYLCAHAPLKKLIFPFLPREEIRFVWRRVPLIEVIANAKPNAYFSHHTASRLNGLTKTNLHTIYLNLEQRPYERSKSHLTQDALDLAFSRPQRATRNTILVGKDQVVLLNGMHTKKLGVVSETFRYGKDRVNIPVTSIERTLIDFTVRPAYAGGTGEVLRAYQNAKGRVSVEHLSVMLEKLDYIYPYHQAIGYYLDVAGYAESELRIFATWPVTHRFYLSHAIENSILVEKWNLYVPQDMPLPNH